MFLAAFGGVAGNFSMLEGVLRHLGDLGILTIAHTGGLLCGGDDAPAIIELIRDSGVICVQGAADRRVARFQRKSGALEKRLGQKDYARIAQAHAALSGAQLEWLQGLPRVRRFRVEGVNITLCHGLPDRAGGRLTRQTPVERLLRQREHDPNPLILCGGAPEPCVRRAGETLFADPGTLAGPDGMGRFTVVDTESAPWQVTNASLKDAE
mgnify:FL=1